MGPYSFNFYTNLNQRIWPNHQLIDPILIIHLVLLPILQHNFLRVFKENFYFCITNYFFYRNTPYKSLIEEYLLPAVSSETSFPSFLRLRFINFHTSSI